MFKEILFYFIQTFTQTGSIDIGIELLYSLRYRYVIHRPLLNWLYQDVLLEEQTYLARLLWRTSENTSANVRFRLCNRRCRVLRYSSPLAISWIPRCRQPHERQTRVYSHPWNEKKKRGKEKRFSAKPAGRPRDCVKTAGRWEIRSCGIHISPAKIVTNNLDNAQLACNFLIAECLLYNLDIIRFLYLVFYI